MKFDALITEQMSLIREAGEQTPEDPNIDPAQSQLPTTDEVDAAPAPMTPEGKIYMTDLARKALAYNPERIPEFDREVLGTTVTPENVDAVLKDIQRIISTE